MSQGLWGSFALDVQTECLITRKTPGLNKKGSGGGRSMYYHTQQRAKLLPKNSEFHLRQYAWAVVSSKTERRCIFKLLRKVYQIVQSCRGEGWVPRERGPRLKWLDPRGKGLAGDPGTIQLQSPRICIWPEDDWDYSLISRSSVGAKHRTNRKYSIEG